MAERIANDVARFRQIIRGAVKRDLKDYISRGELIGKKGRDLVSIPVPYVALPQFRFGQQRGGVGQGPGQLGQPIGRGDGEEPGPGAGSDPADHILEVELTIEEFAQLLGEELELPHIEPRGKKNITREVARYTGVRPVGPESLRHFKRTYHQALRRQLVSGTYEYDRPVIVPVREDRRYRSWKAEPLPSSNAVIIHMMDVSGSMGDEQKELVRITAFWIDTWLKSQYRDVTVKYITHDAEAREVDEHTFFHTRESGGTRISSAFKLANAMIDERFPVTDWNVYLFHFSDGDNWDDDTSTCVGLLRDELLPRCNQFCYGQVTSNWGSGQFLLDLFEQFENEDKLTTAEIDEKVDILDAIKEFLGKGR